MGYISKEDIKKIMKKQTISELLDIYRGMFSSKEDIIDDIMKHDINELNKGLKTHDWDFEIWCNGGTKMGKDDYGEYRESDVKGEEKHEFQFRMNDGMGFPEIKLKKCTICGNKIYQDVYGIATICVDCRTEGK